MKHGAGILACALALPAPAPTFAQVAGAAPPAQIVSTPPDYPRGRISGYFYIDYYYNVAGDPGHSYNASGADTAKAFLNGSTYADGQPKVIGRDLNGVLIRRVYFQHDADLSAKYSTRVRLEVDSRSLTSDGKLGVNVKAAYVEAKNVIPRGSVLAGVVGTPIWEVSEEFWGYRSLEKTIADFRGLGSAADIGVVLKGAVDPEKKVSYTAMIGNGPGQKPEDNRYKKLYLSVPIRPVENLTIEPFADYETAAANKDRATYKLFAGYGWGRVALGGEIVERVNHQTTGRNQAPLGFSMFGHWKAREDLVAVARYDRWQPNTRAADRIDSDLWIAGVDWQPYKDVHVMPNVEAAQYHARGTAAAAPHHDVQGRVTLYWKFSKP